MSLRVPQHRTIGVQCQFPSCDIPLQSCKMYPWEKVGEESRGISLFFLTTAGEYFILKLKKKPILERLIFLSEDFSTAMPKENLGFAYSL